MSSTNSKKLNSTMNNSLRKKYIQSSLRINSKNSKNIFERCYNCNMVYNKDSAIDLNNHKKFHDLSLNGRNWNKSWGEIITNHSKCNDIHNITDNIKKNKANTLDKYFLTPPTSSITSPKKGNNILLKTDTRMKKEYIVEIRKTFNSEIRAATQLMELVNNELNAPHDENDFWSTPSGNGKAFGYIKDNKLVGITTIEILDLNCKRGRWMISDSKVIVENVFPYFKLGISRIWVCKNQRGKGIAAKLLEAARLNTLVRTKEASIELEKWNLAWSQPTEMGGKLALKYNSVKHKSGKLLIPCYI
ncbi:hypothetical protein TBLA_0D05080 [Henningerozyma blattae CBS 6284]|uniref:N-acetyltransferase ECO1 n=1 Tax=Henningerozyma blattae (strain ATCC 34711 / CBS 6284 / DSM 70876 / NBRC 10599 / NRRL Y-10934 / UCD 77-7) TaxID=1071380 RepID=I2H3Q0_HENB6|nr:hypothetical protein TBLA_0D05080 [Tetrapisispora blattae CBS 6284]CCH61002.1 hypothetical protein TBLA_0D05080 [Tetrapisispora blattae CBS 6284]